MKKNASFYNFLFSLIGIFLATTALASETTFDQTHAKWTSVLTENVVKTGKTTKVKYFEIIKNPTALNSYLSDIKGVTAAQYSKWNENQKLAFLFNAYNAFTVKLITQELEKNKDLKSIKKIGGVFTNAWKIKFFELFGKPSYLDEIEQDYARKNFDEPRMHFAFNCASIGCPSLQMTAFTAEKINEQLDQATKEFFADESRNEFNKNKGTLELSSILKWYNEDFENSKKLGPMKKFLATYFPLNEVEKKQLLADKLTIKYLDYNWNLNIWKK